MKIGSVILGFAMICIGIVDLAGQAPVLGIHPAVWFILGVLSSQYCAKSVRSTPLILLRLSLRLALLRVRRALWLPMRT